ncbi:MAG: hypothetical protein HY689_13220 [Chloroflexi bacterium]|nr:hypothetical protein [Chloroflexota bacterium]
MLQVCQDCRSAYHWEFPRFGCACGRYDPSLAGVAGALTDERTAVANVPPTRTGARALWSDTGPRPAAAPGDRQPRQARPLRSPSRSRLRERFDLDDDVEDLPWQHRSRDFRSGNLRSRPAD